MTTVRDSIEVTIKIFLESLNGGDAAGVAAHYTDDAVLLPPNTPRIEGREGIQGVWQGLIDADVRNVALTTQEVDVFGDVANEVGTISATAPSEDGRRAPLTGKYVAVWKRGGDGTWRMRRDIWNFDA
ncbi:MAG: YybH family protein [Geminicoccales bacterium]